MANELVDLGIMTDADVAAFVLMAEHYGIARQAAAAIAEAGALTVEDEHGMQRKHPLLQVFRDSSAAFRAYAAEFGMTPSSRSRLNVTPTAEQLSLADELFGLLETADEDGGDEDDG